MSKLDDVYREFKTLFEMERPPEGTLRAFVKQFVFPMYFAFNERIRKCEAKYEVYKNQEPKPTRVKHIIPDGYITMEEFCEGYFGSLGWMSNTTKSDGDLRSFRKAIGKHIYVEADRVVEFFDSDIGRERYPRMVAKVNRYKEKVNEYQRKRETDSQNPTLL